MNHLRHLLVLCFVVLLASCSVTAATPAPDIRIGVLDSMTGEYSENGTSTLNAANLAIKAYNDAGGIKVGSVRRRIVLVPEDSKNDQVAAIEAAKRLINQQGVVAIVGAPFSKIAIPVAQVAEDAHIPLVSSTASDPAVTQNRHYAFRVGIIDPFQGSALATFAQQTLKAPTAAVLYDVADEYSKGLADVFKQEFQKRNGRIVADESFTTDTKGNIQAQIKRITDAQPAVIFLPNYTEDVPNQIKNLRAAGFTGTFLGSDSWNIDTFAPNADFEGTYVSQSWSAADPDATAVQFRTKYQSAYTQPPNDIAALGYDAVTLVLKAIEQQGATTGDAIRNGILHITDYPGVGGTLSFDGTSGNPKRGAVIVNIKNKQGLFYQRVTP